MLKVKTLSVVGRDAIFFDGSIVRLCGVAHVVFPAILRKFLRNGAHIFVAMRFGKNRRCGNAHHRGIALHDSAVGNIAVRLKPIAIHQNEFRLLLQLLQRAVHGKDGCIEDIDAVNLFGPHMRHRPRPSLLLDDGTQHIALAFRQLFAIVDDLVVKIIGQNHGSRRNRPHKGSTPRFIAPGFYSSRLQKEF